MLKKLCLTVFLLLLFPLNVHAADIVINEIFANPIDENDEFLELYNNTNAEISLENWTIFDKVKTYIIVGLTIGPNGFLSLDKSATGIALNNSDEELTLKNDSDNVVDSFSYNDTIEGKSWSRIPDGTGDFANNVDITKGSANAVPPTPTPTNTPTPTKILTPTKSPTPTKAPTSTKVPTLTKIPTPSLSANSIKDEDNPTATNRNSNNSFSIVSTPQSSNVAGVSDIAKENIEINNSNKEEAPSYLYSLTTGVGMIILACGILLYRKFKARNEEDDDF